MSDSTTDGLLQRLQNWYQSQCDGDWEHEFGIKIENIDNPGWTVSIPVTETNLAGRPFSPVRIQRSAEDWYMCRVEEGGFVGHGGARNLADIIAVFLDWASDSLDAR